VVPPWLRFHIPLIEPGHADFPHPALGQDFTLSHATPSAASEQFSELIGFPISRSFTTYCVCLELRSLPSTGVTRLPRYYEPLRHPRAPGLSLTGFQLIIADHALGLPVFRALSLCTCRRHYPGAASERIASLISSRRISLPRGLSGRPAHCPFRGLLGVHSRCGLHTRAVTNLRHANRRLQPLRYLHDCSDCFRLERLPGGACTHWKAPPLHGARQKQTPREIENPLTVPRSGHQDIREILPRDDSHRKEVWTPGPEDSKSRHSRVSTTVPWPKRTPPSTAAGLTGGRG
jgi:hypothetical protein